MAPCLVPIREFKTEFFRASDEAILGTQRYLEHANLRQKNFRASGEAILGTQRYLEEALYSAVVLLSGLCIAL